MQTRTSVEKCIDGVAAALRQSRPKDSANRGLEILHVIVNNKRTITITITLGIATTCGVLGNA